MTSIKNKFWVWAHPVNSHYNYSEWSPEIVQSRMTPAEAAGYLGVENLLMVRYANQPQPPFDQYAMALEPMKQVVWSILSAIDLKAGISESADPDLEAVLDVARKNKNVTGVVLDDFFGRDGKDAALSVEQLQAIRDKLQNQERKLDIWAVYYDILCGKTPAFEIVEPYLKRCDVLNHWTWNAKDLEHLEENFAKTQVVAEKCDCRIVLGCYMYDYGEKKLMPIELMQKQCELGLKWLNEGSIDGMVFLASCICDIGLETVEWTKNWIRQID